jgi:hypothetical protein
MANTTLLPPHLVTFYAARQATGLSLYQLMHCVMSGELERVTHNGKGVIVKASLAKYLADRDSKAKAVSGVTP